MSFEQAVADLEATNANLVQEVVRVRDAAMGLNRIYPNTSTGLANVNDGQYFAVTGTGDTYMTLYRRNGTSANQISQYPSQAAVDGVVNLLGDAAYKDVMSSLTDTTEGRLMPVGAFGLGASPGNTVNTSPSVIDDEFRRVQFYRSSSGGNTGFGRFGGGVVLPGHTSDSAAQVFIESPGTDQEDENIVFRAWRNDAIGWRPPRKLYGVHNILGTVSQSGGVPTGALFEYGENSNGSYWKFASGLLICSHKLLMGGTDANGSGTYTDPYYTNSANWSFPSSFVSPPEISFQNINEPSAGILERVVEAHPFSLTGNSAGSIRAYNLAGSSVLDITLSAIAIGKWTNA